MDFSVADMLFSLLGPCEKKHLVYSYIVIYIPPKKHQAFPQKKGESLSFRDRTMFLLGGFPCVQPESLNGMFQTTPLNIIN